MLTKSREHLHAAGESYFEHLAFASLVGLMAVGAGLGCLIHALVPALCQRTCSSTVRLLEELFADRSQLPTIAARASGATTFVGLLALSLYAALVPIVVGASAGFAALTFAMALVLPITFLATNTELAAV
jgi:gamma-F420-2:alpha-L-glutamate ligase